MSTNSISIHNMESFRLAMKSGEIYSTLSMLPPIAEPYSEEQAHASKPFVSDEPIHAQLYTNLGSMTAKEVLEKSSLGQSCCMLWISIMLKDNVEWRELVVSQRASIRRFATSKNQSCIFCILSGKF
jgi:hypothetical protein